jgi:hypothetical protein
MSANESRFPDLGDKDLPAGASENLKRQLYALHRIAHQVRYIANIHFLFVKLARRPEFAAAISETPAAYGTRVIVASLLRDMVVGLASLFDQHSEATDLRRVLNEILKKENLSVFDAFHSGFPAPFPRAVQR